jgi:hypothetical protein
VPATGEGEEVDRAVDGAKGCQPHSYPPRTQLTELTGHRCTAGEHAFERPITEVDIHAFVYLQGKRYQTSAVAGLGKRRRAAQ